MEKKKTLLRAVRLLICAATLLAGPIIYFCLVNRGVGDAMMYSAGSPVFVIALSVLGAIGVYLILNKPLFEDYREESLPEEYEEEEIEEEGWIPEKESTESARELYPELFRNFEKAEDDEPVAAPPAYMDALAKAISAQKAEYVPESEGEQKEETENILEIKESESIIPDIYADLPDTLPEGYTPYFEEDEAEEETDEEEETEKKPKRSLPLRIARRGVALLLIIALSVSFGIISALGYTVYDSDGFSVHTVFSNKSYKWQDCEKYDIAPSFFGDRLDITLYMNDGKKIELLPSDLVFGEGFYEKYDSMYEYALHASNVMDEGGAEKSVKERNTIESEFFGRTDIGEDIKNIID